jgi:hypothetical protein
VFREQRSGKNQNSQPVSLPSAEASQQASKTIAADR